MLMLISKGSRILPWKEKLPGFSFLRVVLRFSLQEEAVCGSSYSSFAIQ